MYTYEQIISDMHNKIYKPIYFLMGEEGYFIDSITNTLEKSILSDTEKDFNQTILYGRDTDLGTVINTAKRFPMGANYNVVIVKEAQEIKGLEGAPAGSKDPFLSYAENPVKSTILIINLRNKKLDKRKKIYKTLDNNGCLFLSDKIYENKVGTWVTKYLKDKGYKIEPKAAELIASQLGNNLSKVTNEVDKLLITHDQNKPITTHEIEENIGISKEFNVFELQDAIGKRDKNRALLIATNMAKNPKTKSLMPILANLYSYFAKILTIHYTDNKSPQALATTLGVHPFFVKEYIHASNNFTKGQVIKIFHHLRNYDAISKGINSATVQEEELLKELTYAIITT